MKGKCIIFTFLIFFLVGASQSSPVMASKEEWSQKLLKKVSLYRTEKNSAFTIFANSIISLTGKSQFILPSSLVQSNQPEIVQLATNLTKGLKTDKEKSNALFTWVASNVTYDAEAYFNNPANPRYYSAMETLQNRVALCSGYAHLNAALHRAIGVEAKVVYGEGHAWNEVKILGKWQEQDPTYGSGGLNMDKQIFIPQFKEQYFVSVDLRREGEFPW